MATKKRTNYCSGDGNELVFPGDKDWKAVEARKKKPPKTRSKKSKTKTTRQQPQLTTNPCKPKRRDDQR